MIDSNKCLGQIIQYPIVLDYMLDFRRVDYLCPEAVMHAASAKSR